MVLSKFAHLLLVLTALAPVSLVYGLAMVPTQPRDGATWVGVTVGLVLLCLLIVRGASERGQRDLVNIKAAKNVDKEVLAFLITYALPLVSRHEAIGPWAFWAFIGMVAAVLYQAELVHVNPLLGMLGYRFFEVEGDDGRASLLVTRFRHSVGVGPRSVIQLSTTLWLESVDAGEKKAS